MIESLETARLAIVAALENVGLPIRNVTISFLSREADRRFVVCCRFKPVDYNGSQIRCVTGKFYEDRESGIASFNNLHLIHEALSKTAEISIPSPDIDANFRIPTPICFDNSNRVLVARFCDGVTPREMMSDSKLGEVLQSAGRSLRQLHQLDIAGLQLKNIDNHMADLISPHPQRLAEKFPEFRKLIEETVFELQALAEDRHRFAAVPIHRDFQLRQILFCQEMPNAPVAILDWDDLALGDSLFDVVYLRTYLRNHLGKLRGETLFRCFLDGYGDDGSEIWQSKRWKLYEKFNFLRRACRRFRLKDRNWRAQMEQMLKSLA